jgi:CubicO group peptidase (beta-lactamase class C family)
MNDTLVRLEQPVPSLAAGYLEKVPGKAREREEFTDTRAIGPAANLASSVENLAQFVMLQFRDEPAGGRQILKGSTLREMHRMHWLNGDWRGGRGLGFQIRRVGDQVRVGHSGSLGGYRSRLEFVTASKIGVIALINANDGEPDRFVDQAFTIVGPALAKLAEKPPKPRVADPSWSRYIGKYYWKNSENEVVVLDGELCVLNPDAENPWEARTRLEPEGPHTFRMHGGSAPGELLKFELDAAGRVVRYSAPGVYRLRRDAPTAQPPARSAAPVR